MLISLILAIAVCGCEQSIDTSTPPLGLQRKPIQALHTTFYSVQDGGQRWIEMQIAVDGSKTFRMPVLFTEDGALVEVSDTEADALIDAWIKHRAENMAAFGSVDAQLRSNSPFLAINRKRP